jgi:hypothetical protein
MPVDEPISHQGAARPVGSQILVAGRYPVRTGYSLIDISLIDIASVHRRPHNVEETMM